MSTLQMFTLLYGCESNNMILACQEKEEEEGNSSHGTSHQGDGGGHVRAFMCACASSLTNNSPTDKHFLFTSRRFCYSAADVASGFLCNQQELR